VQKYRFSSYFPFFMTVQAAFTLIINILEPLQGTREAANIAHILMEHLTGMGRMDRVVYKDKPFLQETELQQALTALQQHQPIQYVVGKSWFYGLELMVNSHVLIPRPETEELVEWIVKDVKTAVKILDIGTGSGAIPLALKKELPQAEVWSVDISAGALEVAAANAKQLNLAVHFEQVDILSPAQDLPMFDVIVSNPPYIRESEQEDMEEQVVSYEPRIALFVPDNDALLFYRQIGLLAREKLTKGGRLYFEINEAFGKETVALLEEQGFSNVALKQDIYGKDRMVRGEL
jgi:release factor glutamine methyltransferase